MTDAQTQQLARADRYSVRHLRALQRAGGCSAPCRVIGPLLVECTECGQKKCPPGRDQGMAGGYCDWDCSGYREAPHPSSLWPGEECDPLLCQHGHGPCPDCAGTGNWVTARLRLLAYLGHEAAKVLLGPHFHDPEGLIPCWGACERGQSLTVFLRGALRLAAWAPEHASALAAVAAAWVALPAWDDEQLDLFRLRPWRGQDVFDDHMMRPRRALEAAEDAMLCWEYRQAGRGYCVSEQENAREARLRGHEAQVQQPKGQELPPIRREGDRGLRQLESSRRVQAVPQGYGAEANQSAHARQAGQREGIQPGELSVGNSDAAAAEPLQQQARDVRGGDQDRSRVGGGHRVVSQDDQRQAEARLERGAGAHSSQGDLRPQGRAAPPRQADTRESDQAAEEGSGGRPDDQDRRGVRGQRGARAEGRQQEGLASRVGLACPCEEHREAWRLASIEAMRATDTADWLPRALMRSHDREAVLASVRLAGEAPVRAAICERLIAWVLDEL